MKKTLLFLMCLIGLSAFNQLSAQNDLDIVNNTDCSYTVVGKDYNTVTCSTAGGTTITTTVPASSNFTVTYSSGANYVVNDFRVTTCSGATASLFDFSMCGGSCTLSFQFSFTWDACCGAPLVTFTPAVLGTPGSNAKLTFN